MTEDAKPYLSRRGFIVVVEAPGEDPLSIIRGPLAKVSDALNAVKEITDVYVDAKFRSWTDIIITEPRTKTSRFIDYEIAIAMADAVIDEGKDYDEVLSIMPDWALDCAEEHIADAFDEIEADADAWHSQQLSCNPTRATHGAGR